MIRIVTREKEVEVTLDDLGIAQGASDSEIIRAAERHLDTNLNGLMVSRQGENILVSPTPVFG
jgi:hypothetical protein